MLDNLAGKLQGAFKNLRSKGTLTEADVDSALRDIRLSLLEADVNFKVVKQFVTQVRERAVGEEVLHSLSPGQQVIKIVHDELLSLLGREDFSLRLNAQPPTIIVLAGLQGTGKTTTAGKLGLMLKGQGRRPLLAATDVYRPAAIDQLKILGKEIGIPVFEIGTHHKPMDVAKAAVAHAKSQGHDVVIIDTSGRLHVDQEMMEELRQVKQAVKPDETLMVVDAMTGQDAVNAALEFDKAVDLDGFILTKLDGDARGGAVLSIRAVTGKPIKFIGTGEKAQALEPFHADRLASRILGMGDVLSLIEKAEMAMDEKRTEELERRLRQDQFDLEDFLEQLQQVTKLGPLDQLVSMIPGASKMMGKTPLTVDERQLKRTEAIIYSMTLEERRNPSILGGSRKKRIARGSGTTPADVNRLLNQFTEMRKMLKQVSKGKNMEVNFARLAGYK